MRVATAACTVATAMATGRNTPGAGAGPASAGLLRSTTSGIRPERWAGSVWATSTGDSVPTDSGKDLAAADSLAVSTAVGRFAGGGGAGGAAPVVPPPPAPVEA